VTGGIPHVIGRAVLVTEEVDVPPIGLDFPTIAAAILTFAVAYVLARLGAIALSIASEQTVRHRITIKTLIPLARFTIYFLAVLVVFGLLFDLDSTQLVAFSGVLGAVLGLGVQDLFANVVGGVIITFERPYHPGDMIEFGEYYGEVTGIGLRSTTLVTNDDDEISVPNHKLFTESLANANSGKPQLMAVPELHLANEADIEVASTILRDAMRSSPYLYASDECPIVVRVNQQPAYITLRGRAYVNDVRHEFAFQSDVTERALAAFTEADIETASVPVAIDSES